MLTPTTGLGPHSNTNSDYVFYGIHTVKVLVLKRFVPSFYHWDTPNGKKVKMYQQDMY